MAKKTVDAEPVDAERQARWEAFLIEAEKQATERGTLHIFTAQKERGEFESIPDSFV